MRLLFLSLLLIIICMIPIASATDYYVSLSGNDGNGGQSIGDAWRTWNHAASTITAGDTVWITDGTYANENVVFNNNGTVDNRISFKAYNGTPSINGTDGVETYGLKGDNKEYIDIVGLKVTDYEAGIYFLNSNNIRVSDTNTSSNREAGAGYGIHFHLSNNISIENCVASHNGMSGIIFTTCTYSTVNNSEAYGSDQDYGIVASSFIGENDGGHSIIFSNNHVHDNQHHGVSFRFGVDNGIIENNNISTSEANIEVKENNAANNIVRGNTITIGTGTGGGGITIRGGATNTTIYNNNIVWNTEGGPQLECYYAGDNNYFYNNTLSNSAFWAGAVRSMYTNHTIFKNITIGSGSEYDYHLQASENIRIQDDPESSKIRMVDTSSKITIQYLDSSVFGVSGTASGNIPTFHTMNGYSGTLWLSGTVETITTDISNRNIKLGAAYDYVQDVVVSENSAQNDRYNFTANSSVAENPIWINITVVNASHIYNISRDGIHYDTVTSDSNAIARYFYNITGDEWSNHTFVFTQSSPEEDIETFIIPAVAFTLVVFASAAVVGRRVRRGISGFWNRRIRRR